MQNNDGSQKISGDNLKNVYKGFASEYPIVSIEDPFDQDDWIHYAKMTEEIGAQVQIVGDDLLVTNPTVSFCFEKTNQILIRNTYLISNLLLQRVAKAIKEKACNALLLKVLKLVALCLSFHCER